MAAEGVNIPHEVIALDEPSISWVNAEQELAFVPPLSDEQRGEAHVTLPEGATIVDDYEGEVETSRGLEAATILAVRTSAKVPGSYPEQVSKLPGANAELLEVAVGALRTWWTSKNSETES